MKKEEIMGIIYDFLEEEDEEKVDPEKLRNYLDKKEMEKKGFKTIHKLWIEYLNAGCSADPITFENNVLGNKKRYKQEFEYWFREFKKPTDEFLEEIRKQILENLDIPF